MMDSRRRKTYIVVGLFAVGFVWLVVALQEVFGPLLLALLLAYVLAPAVNWIMKVTKLPRGAAIAALFVFFYAALIGFIALTVPTLIAQVGDMYQALVGDRVARVEIPAAEPEVGEKPNEGEKPKTGEEPEAGKTPGSKVPPPGPAMTTADKLPVRP
ncbi:MAG: AI-2E family transporter, partial [Planctomycetota bacterium]